MARTRGRRHEVLRTVANAEAPLRAGDIAARLDAPLSSVRFHLDSLVESGLLESDVVASQGRGRPALGYRCTAAGLAEAHRAHGRLAGVLVEALALSDGQGAVLEAGRRWGARLAQEDAAAGDGATDTGRDPMPELVSMLRREGFEPREVPRSSGEGRWVELRGCPYLDLAREHPGVVCALHDGAVRGYWEARGGSGEPRMLPFSAPGACHVAIA